MASAGQPTVKCIGLVVALSLGACQRRPADPVILALGDGTVRQSDFDRHVKALERTRGGAVEPGVRAALLEPFLEERILALEARNRGLAKPDASAEEEEQAVQRLLAEAVFTKIAVGDEEVAEYYKDHRQEFQAPETVTLRQILVATENEARDVRRRALRNPKSFDTMARTLSRSPEAASGGLMGTFSRGQLPAELESAAFALRPGGLSEIIATPLGYHILKVDAREVPRERTLEESSDAIRARLLRESSDRAVRQFVLDLLARAKVNHEATEERPSRS